LEEFIKRIDSNELLLIYSSLLIAISNTYKLESRKRGTISNHILYTMMRSQNVTRIFHGDRKNTYVRNLYNRVKDCMLDYKTFWVHWAISEMRCQEYDSAEIHLKYARSLHNYTSVEVEHSFAMLFFNKAIYADTTEESKDEYYKRAHEIIKRQIGTKENDAFSIHSFVVKTLQYYNSMNKIVPDNIMKEMIDYYNIAKEKYELDLSDMRRNILRLIYSYVKVEHPEVYNINISFTQDELQYIMSPLVVEDNNVELMDYI
jgi:hypothetical protein